jgi:hypothetical protein
MLWSAAMERLPLAGLNLRGGALKYAVLKYRYRGRAKGLCAVVTTSVSLLLDICVTCLVVS